jgi:ABC-type transporter Mla subunit MlaD
MGEAERDRFLETLRRDPAFREAVRRELLSQELLLVPEGLERLTRAVEEESSHIAAQSEQVAQLASVVRRHSGQIARNTEQVAQLASVVRRHSGQVEGLTLQVPALVDVVARQRRDLSDLAALTKEFMERTTAFLKEVVALMRDGFRPVRAEIVELRGEVHELRENTTRGFAGINARFDQVDGEIWELSRRRAS